MKIKSIFWNQEDSRPRAAWRLCLHVLILIGLTMVFGLVSGILILIIRLLASDFVLNETYTNLLFMFGLTLVILSGSFIAARWVDKREIKSLGFQLDRKWWKDFLFGTLLGIFLMGVIFIVELSMGWIKVVGNFSTNNAYPIFWLGLLIFALQFIFVGVYEETMFRSYQLLNLAEGLSFLKDQKTGLLVSYLLTSCIFGILHAINPGATWFSVFNIMLAGLFLGLGLLLTGRIGLSIGLHITWNFFQGNVFGFPVSGTTTGVSLIEISQQSNAAVTGGNFGPEGGLIGIMAIVLGAVCIYYWVQWQYGHVELKILQNLRIKKEPVSDDMINNPQ